MMDFFSPSKVETNECFPKSGNTDQTEVKGRFVTRVGSWLSKARRLLGVQFLSVLTRDLGVCPEPES